MAGLSLVFFALALAIGWLARTGWRQTAELRDGLLIAEQVDEQVVILQGKLHALDPGTPVAQWQRFSEESAAVGKAIGDKRSQLTTAPEHELLDRILRSYTRYLATLTTLVDQLHRGQWEKVPPERLSELLDGLTEVRRQGVGQFLADSHRYLATLQKANIALLTALVAVVVWFALVVYRGMIAPLRVKLVETYAVLEQSQKLASLGVMAAGVAHEIRNPLTAIKARLYTHRKAFAPGSAEYLHVEFVNEEINRLERIVREFLQFARPSEPQLAAVSPAHLLQGVYELLAPELAKASLQLTIGEVVDTAISADENQLRQVLINLVNNAAESIGSGGKIILRARLGRVARLRGKDAVILEVEDTGKGIPLEVQKRLFDPFFSTKPSGTGLGLAIAARIVDKHGGALQFKTRVNQGTTFGIVLPMEKKP